MYSLSFNSPIMRKGDNHWWCFVVWWMKWSYTRTDYKFLIAVPRLKWKYSECLILLDDRKEKILSWHQDNTCCLHDINQKRLFTICFTMVPHERNNKKPLLTNIFSTARLLFACGARGGSELPFCWWKLCVLWVRLASAGCGVWVGILVVRELVEVVNGGNNMGVRKWEHCKWNALTVVS